MKKIYTVTLILALLSFVAGACCGLPKTSLSTVANEGFVKILAVPEDADVYINGVNSGAAKNYDGKKQVMALPAGRHKIEIKKQGYHPYSREMMVGAGATETIKITLSAK